MRNKLMATLALGLSAATIAAAPIAAEAATHRTWVCDNPRRAANTGTVVGAVAGGLLGNAVSHGGGKTGGTLLGAGVGAVAGHQLAKKNAKKNCHYAYVHTNSYRR